MLKQLPDTLNTFSYNSQATISSLIREMKLDKSDLSLLVSKLSAIRLNTSYSPSAFDQFSVLNREFFIDMFRDADLRMRSYYSAVNTVSLMLNSMTDIISSEIEKVEKDLEMMSTFVDNYEFLSGKDDLYNSSYIEKFENNLNDYRSDGYVFELVDRDGVNFADNGNGFVDKKVGEFKIGQRASFSNPLDFVDNISVKTNYSNYVTTDSGFYAALNESKSDSWNVTVKSPVILTSRISDSKNYINYNQSYISGAETMVEMSFAFPQEMDAIYITPGNGNGLQLLQVVLFSDKAEYGQIVRFPFFGQDENTNPNSSMSPSSLNIIPLLSSPKILDSISEIVFPRTNVSKVVLIFNQPIYSKNEKTTSTTELNGKAIYEIGKMIRRAKEKNPDIIQDVVYNLFLKNNSIRELFKNKYFNESYYSFKYPYIKNNFLNKEYRKNFLKENIDFESLGSKFSTIISNMFQNFFIHSINDNNEIFEDKTYIESFSQSRSIYNFRSPGLIPQKNSNNITENRLQSVLPISVSRSNDSTLKDLLFLEKIDMYEYNFSIKAIEFATIENDRSEKACFVSKKMPFNGYPLALKILLSEGKSSLNLQNYDFDLKNPVSYELSISNIEIPISESDWIPILPFGSDKINSEVLFFDEQTQSAKTRFYFIKETISIYQNGYKLNTNEYIIKENEIVLINFNPNSIYVCEYYTDLKLFSYDNIDFLKSNIFQESTKSFFDSDGQGERFSSTDYLGRVTLKNLPYINTKFAEGATYNPNFGTIFSSEYQNYSPVKILMSDGSYALNLTNYTTSRDLPSFPVGSGYYFMQNGKDIVFNQIVTEPFSVIYEYVSNSSRFRLIIRKNIPNILYSGSVNSVLVKAKTKNYDPYYDKLNKVIV
jgi:hypothetical protein